MGLFKMIILNIIYIYLLITLIFFIYLILLFLSNKEQFFITLNNINKNIKDKNKQITPEKLIKIILIISILWIITLPIYIILNKKI